MLFTLLFSFILNLSLLRPRVSSQRYVENVELVRELFLEKAVVEKTGDMEGKCQTNLSRPPDAKP